ncbi:MAG: META domain-containing protein [Piscinibacter sp.]|nr:META domain-containing protein [Piscinibacter sp.]
MPRTLRPILSFVASALVACAAPTAPPPTLAGTQWQLMAIQSMDDAQGTTRPSTPQHYTVSFGADGRATLRLDCNRAFATWQATPSADGVSGQLMLGPLAGTRAHCGPDSLDQRLTRQLPYVRSYLLRDGQLHLSLMADGGILSWSPLK